MSDLRLDPFDMTEWCFDRMDETNNVVVAMFWILAGLGCIALAIMLLAGWLLLGPLVWLVTLGRCEWVPKWL